MKKFLKKSVVSMLLITLALFNTSCHRAAPEPGFHTVLIMKPLIFGSGGIDKDVVKEGATICAPTTSTITVQMSPSTRTIQLDDYTTADNNHVDMELNLMVQCTDAYELISKFGENWYEDNLVKKVSDIMREKVLGINMFDLKGNAIIQDSVRTLAFNEFKDYVDRIGMPIRVNDLLINSIIPPAGIMQETENTGVQRQRMITFNAQRNAEQARKEVEELKAKADMAYKTQMGFNNDQYIKAKALEVYHQVQLNYIDLARTDPDVNLTIVTGNSTPVTSVGNP